jgi:4-carboxymuconolactone decarboxylase
MSDDPPVPAQGGAARVGLLEPAQWSPQAGETLKRWNPPFNIHKALANAPALMGAWIGFGNHILFNSLLPAREREIVILRIAWNARCAYEWGQHARVAAMVGMDRAEVDRIPHGPDATGWSAHDAALIRATDTLQSCQDITDGDWAVLKETFSDEQMIDLIFLTGEFVLVAMALKALRVPPDAGLEPLPPEPA